MRNTRRKSKKKNGKCQLRHAASDSLFPSPKGKKNKRARATEAQKNKKMQTHRKIKAVRKWGRWMIVSSRVVFCCGNLPFTPSKRHNPVPNDFGVTAVSRDHAQMGTHSISPFSPLFLTAEKSWCFPQGINRKRILVALRRSVFRPDIRNGNFF
jgi:hypothetical protein